MGYDHTMKSRRHIARLIAASVLVVGAGLVATPAVSPSVQAAPCTLCGGGEFHPLTPARIFDSRPGLAINDVAPVGAKPLGAPEPATFDIGLLGLGGIPADAASVLAVVVNITVTEPGANGYLEAYGKGAQPAEHTSIINFGPGKPFPTWPSSVPAPMARSPSACTASVVRANVVVDVFGWFSTSAYTGTDGARLIPTTPSRILDTRDGTGRPAPLAPLGAGQTIDAADPRCRRRQPDRDRRRAGRPASPACCSTWSASPPSRVARQRTSRCSPTHIGGVAPDDVQPQPGSERHQGQPGLRAGRRRRQGADLQRPRHHPGRRRRGRLHAERPGRDHPRRPSRAADVAVPHLRHPPGRTSAASPSGRVRPRIGASPTSPAPCSSALHRSVPSSVSSATSRRHELKRQYPSQVGPVVPHGVPVDCCRDRRRRTSTRSKVWRSPTWPC